MIRPVTWTGNDSVASSDPEEEMHEHEQVSPKEAMKSKNRVVL